MSRFRRTLPALLIGLSGCGFSNAMYNARHSVGDAERAAQRGDETTARSAYIAAIDRAAVAYRKDPDGQHAGEALYLVGRSRFGLGEYAAARAALQRSVELAASHELRDAATAWLGAAELELGRPREAKALLDSAIAGRPPGELMARAHLWRARARVASSEAGAWEDLDRAVRDGGAVAHEALLQTASLAVVTGDSARARTAFSALLADGEAARPDSLATLAHAAALRWGPDRARTLIDVAGSGWPAAARDTMLVVQAELAALDGDTADALRTVLLAADRLGGTGAERARLLAARWRLRAVAGAAELADVRALLLPTVASADVQQLLERLRVLGALIDLARDEARALALFAAAEVARDELDAPVLARALFLDYADRAPESIWSPKALLAAAALGAPEDELLGRLAAAGDNVYVGALRGDAQPAVFAAAEERLARELTDIRADAAAAAGARDPTVGRAVAVLDSLRSTARLDSLRVRCAVLIDSVVVNGIRADSVRSACMRDDSARIVAVLRMDTLLLRDTTAADSVRPRRRAVIDTLRNPHP